MQIKKIVSNNKCLFCKKPMVTNELATLPDFITAMHSGEHTINFVILHYNNQVVLVSAHSQCFINEAKRPQTRNFLSQKLITELKAALPALEQPAPAPQCSATARTEYPHHIHDVYNAHSVFMEAQQRPWPTWMRFIKSIEGRNSWPAEFENLTKNASLDFINKDLLLYEFLTIKNAAYLAILPDNYFKSKGILQSDPKIKEYYQQPWEPILSLLAPLPEKRIVVGRHL